MQVVVSSDLWTDYMVNKEQPKCQSKNEIGTQISSLVLLEEI